MRCPRGDGPVARPAHPLEPLATDLVGIDVVAVGPPQRGVERRPRRDHVDRVTVGVHDVGVGELGQQRVQVAEVRRRLQDERTQRLTAPPLLPLQQLQHPPQPPVGRGEVLRVDPRPVAGHVARGLGDVRQEGVGQEDDLLLGLVDVGGVDGEQLGGEGADLLLPAPRRPGSAGRRRRGPSPAGAPARPPPSRTRRRSGDRWPAPAGAGSCPSASCRRRRSARAMGSSRISGWALHHASARSRCDQAAEQAAPQDHWRPGRSAAPSGASPAAPAAAP